MLELGYWRCRGVAEPIRMLLEYTKLPYRDVRYECGDRLRGVTNEWDQVVAEMDLDFPALPYLVDGELRLTQVGAVLRYIARLHDSRPKEAQPDQSGSVALSPEKEASASSDSPPAEDAQATSVTPLLGSDLQAQAKADMVYEWGAKLRDQLVKMWYNPDFSLGVAKMELRRKVSVFENFLLTASMKSGDELAAAASTEQQRQPRFFTGSTVAWCDFPMYDVMDQVRSMDPHVLSDFEHVSSFMGAMEDLLAPYLASDRFRPWPLTNPMASFGANGPPAAEVLKLWADRKAQARTRKRSPGRERLIPNP